MEQLTEKKYQFCIVDPEGDYGNLENTVLLGSNQSPPILDEIVRILERPDQNPVVNLLAVPLQDRPQFFRSFLPRIHELRARTGRPHWVLLDEAHHMLPASTDVSPALLQKGSHNYMIITVHPKHVSSEVLSAADVVIAIAGDPEGLFRDFTETLGHGIPKLALPSSMEPREAVVWFRRKEEGPFRFRSIQSRITHQRHLRKYAEGTLSPERSFYFQGPDGKLNLRAQNLFTFIQLAEGIDDETWLYHLKNGDVSGWFRRSIKDEGLASAAEIIVKMYTTPKESRRLIKKAIEERYTLPS
jgi:hypothetical protein